jgi:hypothetical protein
VRRTFWPQSEWKHLGMDDAALGGKVVAAVQALVAQQRGGA